MVPLSYETMDYASSFSSTECQEGIVGISSHTLRIITPERLGEVIFWKDVQPNCNSSSLLSKKNGHFDA